LTHACITIDPDGLAIAIHCASSGYVQGGVGDQVHEFVSTDAAQACGTPQELATALVAWMTREGGWVPPEVEFDSPGNGMTGPVGDNEYDYTLVKGAGGWEIDVFPAESLGEKIVHPRERGPFVPGPGRAGQTIALLGVPDGLDRDEVKALLEQAGATVVDELGEGVTFAVIADHRESLDYFKNGVSAIGARELDEVRKAEEAKQRPPVRPLSAHQGRLTISYYDEQFPFLISAGAEPADFGEELIKWVASDEAAMCEAGSSLAAQAAVDLNHPDMPLRLVYDPDGTLSAEAAFVYSLIDWQNPKDRYDYGLRIGDYPERDEQGQPVVHPSERDPEELPEPSSASGAYYKAGGEVRPRMVSFSIGGSAPASSDGFLLDEELASEPTSEPAPEPESDDDSKPQPGKRVKVELRQGDTLDQAQALEAIKQIAAISGLELPLGGPWVVVLTDAWDDEAEVEWPRVIGGFASDEEAHAWIHQARPPGGFYTVTVTAPDAVELT
jgi:hypothetical protein